MAERPVVSRLQAGLSSSLAAADHARRKRARWTRAAPPIARMAGVAGLA